jgi:hypothetical protein
VIEEGANVALRPAASSPPQFHARVARWRSREAQQGGGLVAPRREVPAVARSSVLVMGRERYWRPPHIRVRIADADGNIPVSFGCSRWCVRRAYEHTLGPTE